MGGSPCSQITLIVGEKLLVNATRIIAIVEVIDEIVSEDGLEEAARRMERHPFISGDKASPPCLGHRVIHGNLPKKLQYSPMPALDTSQYIPEPKVEIHPFDILTPTSQIEFLGDAPGVSREPFPQDASIIGYAMGISSSADRVRGFNDVEPLPQIPHMSL
jgi:hypothetical protein